MARVGGTVEMTAKSRLSPSGVVVPGNVDPTYPGSNNVRVDAGEINDEVMNLLGQIGDLAFKENPEAFMLHRSRLTEAWTHICTRRRTGEFGMPYKFNNADVFGYPAMVIDMALFTGKAPDGMACMSRDHIARFAFPLAEVPKIVGRIVGLYRQWCNDHGKPAENFEPHAAETLEMVKQERAQIAALAAQQEAEQKQKE